jgi:hypothetical protein
MLDSYTGDWTLKTKVGDLGGGVPPAFFNGDGSVDGKDLALFLLCYRGTALPEADVLRRFRRWSSTSIL